MILYYAQGGGLGHLSRSKAVWNTLNLPLEKIILLSSSSFVNQKFIPEKVQITSPPPELSSKPLDYQKYLANIFEKYSIESVFLDSFPLGIIGEWQNFKSLQQIPVYYIARLLQWEKYIKQFSNTKIHFKKTYLLEILEEKHLDFIKKHSKSSENLSLKYPQEKATQEKINLPPFWLILHSEPLEEVKNLWSYAQEKATIENQKPFWVICSQVAPQDFFSKEKGIWINEFPATNYIAQAQRILTAAGFNTLQECKAYKSKHHILPFFRKYDNQFLRAKNYKNGFFKEFLLN